MDHIFYDDGRHFEPTWYWHANACILGFGSRAEWREMAVITQGLCRRTTQAVAQCALRVVFHQGPGGPPTKSLCDYRRFLPHRATAEPKNTSLCMPTSCRFKVTLVVVENLASVYDMIISAITHFSERMRDYSCSVGCNFSSIKFYMIHIKLTLPNAFFRFFC